MHYPWWYVPGLTAPMLIALVAVLHIYVSQYAVGGGIILAAETARAHREGDGALLAYLKQHTWFFVLVTVVYGAMSGVGIWWTIGLASPLATEALIHIFVFGWAIEWCAFIVEIVAAFLFYYGWDRLTPTTHTRIGWIYAGAAWISLVLITGITGFMLNNGSWVPGTGAFWSAFFNPQFLPQVMARTGGALLLTAAYVYLHASFRLAEDDPVRERIIARTTRYTLPGAVLIGLGGIGWFIAMPASGKAIVEGTGAMNVFAGLVVALTALVVALLLFCPARQPSQVSRSFAVALLCLSFMAIGASEFLREAARKPYVVFNLVYGHGLYKDEIALTRRVGLLRQGVWPSAYARLRFPGLVDADGKVDPERTEDLDPAARIELGQTLFMYHCNDCHAKRGYSGLHGIIRGWSPDMLADLVRRPEVYHFYMPPWSGTDAEAQLLTEYLISIRPPHPLAGNEPVASE